MRKKGKIPIIPVKIHLEVANEASEWCAERWGNSVVLAEIVGSKNVLIDGTQLIIPETNVWKHLHWNEWVYLKGIFYFKDERKALEFKIMWCGNV